MISSLGIFISDSASILLAVEILSTSNLAPLTAKFYEIIPAIGPNSQQWSQDLALYCDDGAGKASLIGDGRCWPGQWEGNLTISILNISDSILN